MVAECKTSNLVTGNINATENKLDFLLFRTDQEDATLAVDSSKNSDIENSDDYILGMESDHIKPSCEDEFSTIGDLSPEVSAIYLAMQHSKLECIDEKSQDSTSDEVCAEPEDSDFEDFDPFLFIKDLPQLSAIVPRYRPVLLPKQTRSCPSTTLVLDLDGLLGQLSWTATRRTGTRKHTAVHQCVARFFARAHFV
ncbi:hypothetical protein AXF42_Ash004825 [Apostasia shenzhenica]|uniref:Uncharacterized protein n=1 Tax=Apostasia shenzhenica TaxID=1088818 RepID=A0A2I0B7P5_9ASPA|nr:hypothetical protein AXF42_Ash004825 [Apostasia shenzhenica]